MLQGPKLLIALLSLCLPACSCGGVVVTSADGKIVCSNTLDDRLRITYSSNLPSVRSLLFGSAA